MIPVRQNIRVQRGKTFALDVNIKLGKDKVPMLQTAGTSIRMQVRICKDAPELIAEPAVYIDRETGNANFSLAAPVTQAIPSGEYWYDIATIDETAEPSIVEYWLEGDFTIDGVVTEVNNG